MKVKIIIGFIAILLSLNACATVSISHLKVHVVNEEGKPVEDAVVQGYFTNLRYDYVASPQRKGITDAKGMVQISGPALSSVNIDAYKKGYYQSDKKIPVNLKKDQDLTVILREKKNPIAMYAKSTSFALDEPIHNVWLGYDLEKDDFLPPHGKGVTRDLEVLGEGWLKDLWTYRSTKKIRFPNYGDGLVAFYIEHDVSDFKSDYLSPLSSYQGQWEFNRSQKGKGFSEETNRDRRRNYYFRVRTETNDKGEIISAHYGKIYGEFGGRVTYYFNPTPNDRNVEFDPQKNLFKNLTNE